MYKENSALPSQFGLLLLLWGSHFLFDFCTGIFPVYKTLAGFDLTYSALIVGLLGFVGELSQVVFGKLGDAGKRKWGMILGMILASSAFFFPLTGSLSSAWILVLFVMIGSASFHPCAAGLAGVAAKMHKSNALAIFASGGAIGLAISQVCFSSLHAMHPLLSLVFFLPMAFVIYTCYRFPLYDPKSEEKSSPLFSVIFGKLFKIRSLVLLYAAQICNYGFMFSLIFYLPDALKSKGAAEWLWKGGGHLLLILGNGIALPVLGRLCSSFNYFKVLFSAGLIGLLGFALFLSMPHLSTLSLAILLFTLGTSVGSMNPLCVSWGIRMAPQYPSSVASMLMGLAWAFADLFTAASGTFIKLFPSQGMQSILFAMLLLFSVGLAFLRSASLAERREELAS